MTFKRYLFYPLRPVLERKFTYFDYESFLKSISDSNTYQVVTLRDFLEANSRDRVVISLRHDVDKDLPGALEMARLEHRHNIQATYYILHTARYYGVTRKNYAEHDGRIIPVLQKMQNEYGHEIGWHNDLVTLECVHGMNPTKYLQEELQWLRDNGIHITGTAPHGSMYGHKFKYHNKYFFNETLEKVDGLPNNESVSVGDRQCIITKANLTDFGLTYEAYHLDNNFYFSDCSYTGRNEGRWHPEELTLEDFRPGDKIIILTHPCHWDYSVRQKYLKLVSSLVAKMRGEVV